MLSNRSTQETLRYDRTIVDENATSHIKLQLTNTGPHGVNAQYNMLVYYWISCIQDVPMFVYDQDPFVPVINLLLQFIISGHH